MKELRLLKSNDPTEIYCFGDNYSLLKFELGSLNWMKIPVENDKVTAEAFDGTFRY